MGPLRTIPLLGTATARAQTTFASHRFDQPFTLEQVNCRFPTGCQNLLQLAFWISPDDEEPSSGNPSGVNLLQDYSPTPYLRGDGEQITLSHQTGVPQAGCYLKVVATNDDWYDHDVDVEFTISLMEKGAPANGT